MYITQEMLPETEVLTEVGLVHSEKPFSPKVELQGPSVPFGEEVLEKSMDEVAAHKPFE